MNAIVSGQPGASSYTNGKLFAGLTLLIIVIRLIFIPVMGLMPQDAYYDFYAQHLALSYYDHPPMIAYLLRLFTSLFGKKVFALKLADSTVTWLTVWAFYTLAKRFLGPHQSRKALVLLLSTFMVTILSLISTPDVPLLLTWTLSLLFLHKAISGARKLNWLWAGIFSGLCFDSKYTAVFLILGVTGFLIISPKHRKLLFSRWFVLYLFSFAVCIVPVVVWNISNGFASFKFQSEARVNSMEGFHISLTDFGGVIGHQSAILTPFLLLSFFYFLYRVVRKYGWRFARIPGDILFLLSFFVPLFLGFLLISFFYWVKLNWMMPAYVTGIIWVCRYWQRRWIRIQLFFSLLLHVALALEVIFYVVPIRSDDTWFGWEDFSRQVSTLRQRVPSAFIFSADDYKTSAVLNFYLDEMVYSKNVVGQRALQFDFVGTNLQMLKGKSAFFIDSNPRFDNLENENGIPAFISQYFDRIEPLQPILVMKNGHAERKFSVFLCTNYHPPAAPAE